MACLEEETSKDFINTSRGKTKRREFLREIEEKVQALWKENNVYYSNPPDSWFSSDNPVRDDDEKFFCTFPYPYMNGRLHLGHAFSLTKAEFQARFQRLKGKRVLWPFAFHCTGMPICACADKLREEFNDGVNLFEGPATQEEADESFIFKFSSSKSKAVSKTIRNKSQKEILLSCGVPEDLIPQFVNAEFWVSYFPSVGEVVFRRYKRPDATVEQRELFAWLLHMENDLKRFGIAVDWRRSFVTTQVNPYYDAFVRWQFNTLKKRNRIAYGNRATIFSRIDGQACADHDRMTGEGAGPQCYTLIKMKVKEFPSSFQSIQHLSTRSVYFVAATLRPETMYGQTNCFILPTGSYGFYLALDKRSETADEDEVFCVPMTLEEALQKCHQVFVCSERSAQNMVYQGILPASRSTLSKVYEPICLGMVKGESLIGVRVSSPRCFYDSIYVLPMMVLSLEKGTGIVTSVPSDSADDYAALQDLENKPAFREKYGITEEMISYKAVSVVYIPGYEEYPAIQLYNAMKVKSQQDRVLLEKIKEELYRKGFYEGIMMKGLYKGEKVHKIKDLERDAMIKEGKALLYYEPERQVLSRKGDSCVVALYNQWYLDYSNQEWKDTVLSFVSDAKYFNAFSPQCLNQFKHVIQWIREWACSRQYGLGTYIPWERKRGKKVIIESLSDSTIYMAYYTIAHYLQGNLDGSCIGSLKIDSEDLTDDAFDYIFMQTEKIPEKSSIPKEKLDVLRKEFQYWYPMNLRVSGKDLIFNHLTKCLFDHAAIWPKSPETKWPRSFFCNGHVLVDNQKMSKSVGNFLTLNEAIETYTADGSRIALADAGDSLDDANFQREQANAALMKLYLLEQFAEEIVQERDKGNLRKGDKQWMDKAFENEMVYLFQTTVSAYELMLFRNALKVGFYDMGILRDQYRNLSSQNAMHQESIFLWLELQTVLLSPIAPHLCEHIWIQHLKKDVLLSNFPYLKTSSLLIQQVDLSLHKQYNLLLSFLEDFRAAMEKSQGGCLQAKRLLSNSEESKGAVIYVAKKYLPWQQTVLKILQDVPLAPCQRQPLDNTYIDMIKNHPEVQKWEKKQRNQAMSFGCYRMKVDLAAEGPQALQLELPFNEKELIEANCGIIRKLLGVEFLDVYWTTDSKHPLDTTDRISLAIPCKPSIAFFSTTKSL